MCLAGNSSVNILFFNSTRVFIVTFFGAILQRGVRELNLTFFNFEIFIIFGTLLVDWSLVLPFKILTEFKNPNSFYSFLLSRSIKYLGVPGT